VGPVDQGAQLVEIGGGGPAVIDVGLPADAVDAQVTGAQVGNRLFDQVPGACAVHVFVVVVDEFEIGGVLIGDLERHLDIEGRAVGIAVSPDAEPGDLPACALFVGVPFAVDDGLIDHIERDESRLAAVALAESGGELARKCFEFGRGSRIVLGPA